MSSSSRIPKLNHTIVADSVATIALIKASFASIPDDIILQIFKMMGTLSVKAQLFLHVGDLDFTKFNDLDESDREAIVQSALMTFVIIRKSVTDAMVVQSKVQREGKTTAQTINTSGSPKEEYKDVWAYIMAHTLAFTELEALDLLKRVFVAGSAVSKMGEPPDRDKRVLEMIELASNGNPSYDLFLTSTIAVSLMIVQRFSHAVKIVSPSDNGPGR